MRLGSILAVALTLPLCLSAPRLLHATAEAPPSLAGLWRIDASRSDFARQLRNAPERRERKEPTGPGDPADGAKPRVGERGGPGGPGGHRPGRLPELLRIAEKGGVMILADSAGVILQQITMDGRSAPAPASGSTILELTGHWKSGALEVERPGWRGNTAVDRWSLGEGGSTLSVETKLQGQEALPRFQTKRVYLKVG